MRFLQANKAYHPHLGGIETIVKQLAEGFAAQPGHSSAVIACSDDTRTHHADVNGVSVTYSGTWKRLSSLPISPSYPSQLLRQEADVLLIHEPSLLAAAACAAFPRQARRRFSRRILWWHSDIIRQRSLQPLYTPVLRTALREADAIVVATPKHITSSSLLPEFASKCRVIHFGVEPGRFRETDELQARAAALRAEYRKPIILFVGRLVYYKGAEYLIRAMRGIQDAHLVIVGRGPLLGDLEQLARECSPDISFVPTLPEAELAAMYKAASMFVLPSVEDSEAFGIVQLEAMAHGKPVITADLATGVTYVNQDGVTGLVVPRRDPEALEQAITRLLRDDALRQRLGAQAQARVLREFTVDNMVSQTLGLAEELLASGKKRGKERGRFPDNYTGAPFEASIR